MGGLVSTERVGEAQLEADDVLVAKSEGTLWSHDVRCPRCSEVFDTDPSAATAKHLPITCKECFDCTRCSQCSDQANGICPQCERKGLDSSLPDRTICSVLATNRTLPYTRLSKSKEHALYKYQVGMTVETVCILSKFMKLISSLAITHTLCFLPGFLP